MLTTINFIVIVLCIIELIIFDWFTRNFTYTDYFYWNSSLNTRENSKPIKIKRLWYILYCICMLIPGINVILFIICTIMSLLVRADLNYYYNGNNNFILTIIKYKNKIKYYLNTEV